MAKPIPSPATERLARLDEEDGAYLLLGTFEPSDTSDTADSILSCATSGSMTLSVESGQRAINHPVFRGCGSSAPSGRLT